MAVFVRFVYRQGLVWNIFTYGNKWVVFVGTSANNRARDCYLKFLMQNWEIFITCLHLFYIFAYACDIFLFYFLRLASAHDGLVLKRKFGAYSYFIFTHWHKITLCGSASSLGRVINSFFYFAAFLHYNYSFVCNRFSTIKLSKHGDTNKSLSQWSENSILESAILVNNLCCTIGSIMQLESNEVRRKEPYQLYDVSIYVTTVLASSTQSFLGKAIPVYRYADKPIYRPILWRH